MKFRHPYTENLFVEVSLFTFVLLWTMAQLPMCRGQEAAQPQLQDVLVKTIKESKNCASKAEAGDHLKVHYVGRLTDENGKIFDESRPRGRPFPFQLGAGQVIQGYERGVPGMCLGETRTLTVPSHLAYGDNGIPQAGIPGGATLHFTVELIEIKKGKLESLHPNLRMDL